MCSHYEILFLSKKAANISAGATPLLYTSEGKITFVFEGETKHEKAWKQEIYKKDALSVKFKSHNITLAFETYLNTAWWKGYKKWSFLRIVLVFNNCDSSSDFKIWCIYLLLIFLK